MNKIWRLFKSDVKRLSGNVVTIIAVLGLVALPSIFSWYNIIACWDVFGNTGNLTVAVANSDEGYTSDLAPFKINIGDQITSTLRENDQLNWVFTDEEDAIDGVSAGRYYASVVIPASFSRDMMSFYSEDMEHAQITYYSNQKKSAIAPKVTDQGADQISNQVNEVFAETISEVALGLANALLDYADESDANGRLGDLANHVNRIGLQLDDSAAALSSYSNVLESTQALVRNSGELLKQVQSLANDSFDSVRDAKQKAQDAIDAMSNATSHLNETIAQSASRHQNLADGVNASFDNAAQAAEQAETRLRDEAAWATEHGLSILADRLTHSADSIHEASTTTQEAREQALQLADEVQADLDTVRRDFQSDVQPTLESVAATITSASSALSRTTARLDAAGANISGSTDSIASRIGDVKDKLDQAASDLSESSLKLGKLSDDIASALNSNDLQTLRKIIGTDPSVLASAIAAPVKLERIAIYPVENFGSAMSPLYTTLALWIGALLIMVTLRTHPSPRTLEEAGNPTSRQVFIGRFLVLALINLMQSTVLSLGNLLFLGVQAVNPFLYVLCFWVAGLVFAFIIYTMVALFANLGKALGVVLLIVQVSGGGGSFPLQLLPPFFQAMSPYLPIAHAVRAMRAAMFGIYNGDFWMEIGILLLFTVPFGILGLALHYPLGKIVPKFIERVEQSKLM